MFIVLVLSVFPSLVLSTVRGEGLLILYRPYDVTFDCTESTRLRFDLSYGMGLSDTITLVFRTLDYIDYHCSVEIVAESPQVYLIISILYPTTLESNCIRHPNAIRVQRKNANISVCDFINDRDRSSLYYKSVVKERIKIIFQSNSSINLDMRTHMYQFTATAARQAPPIRKCSSKNETECMVNKTSYCFTSGVVCDGIRNCGVPNWFDERLDECGITVQTLGFPQVFALSAALLFAALSVCHILAKCLPPLANSFFVFNANEDNRLCVDPVFTTPVAATRDIYKVPRMSLVPVSSDSSSTDAPTTHELSEDSKTVSQVQELSKETILRRTTAMRSMTAKLQEKIRAVTKSKHITASEKLAKTSRSNDIEHV